MRSNAELVNYLRGYGYLQSAEAITAFESIDRVHFVPSDEREQAYMDRPLPTLSGQTISAPSMVAMMTETFAPRAGEKILEVGTGSGYQVALLAHMVGPKGKVITIERLKELTGYASERIKKHYPKLCKRLELVTGDGSGGHAKGAPYDAIIVTSAAPRIPKPLIEQLKVGGRIVIPIGSPLGQSLVLARKGPKGQVESVELMPVMFVPLIGKYGFSKDETPRLDVV